MNQTEFLTITCNLLKARDSKVARLGLDLVVALLLIVEKLTRVFRIINAAIAMALLLSTIT